MVSEEWKGRGAEEGMDCGGGQGVCTWIVVMVPQVPTLSKLVKLHFQWIQFIGHKVCLNKFDFSNKLSHK